MLEILDKDENAVSLHIRRGDYLQPKHWLLPEVYASYLTIKTQ